MTRRFKNEKTFPLRRFSDQTLEDTIASLQPRYPDRKLSGEDAREIISNVARVIQLLRE